MTTPSLPVTVVIPCFNSSRTIHRTLYSVIQQTNIPSEIIVVDDFSRDETLRIIRQFVFPPSIRVVVIECSQNCGPGNARNLAWDGSTQPWLAFLDSDDVWHPQKLEIQYGWLTNNPAVELCGHLSSQLGPPLSINSLNEIASEKVSLNRLLLSNMLPTRSVMVKTNLPYRFGGIDVCEDYLLWLELCSLGVEVWRINACLSYSIRRDFSAGGYSGNLWVHEVRELRTLRTLSQRRLIGFPVLQLACCWSVMKFLRRVIIRLLLR